MQETSEVSIGNIIPEQLKSLEFELPPLITEIKTKRFAFPLTLTNSDEYVSHRMALIGDAAHRIHPMAGQGLNLGLSDVAFLANNIIKAKNGGTDIGSLEHVLENYNF